LLLGGTTLAAIAPAAKLYALVPLIIQARWRAILLAVPILALSLPLWPTYLRNFSDLQQVLGSQASGGLSAWGTALIIPVALSLVVMGRAAASWLAVPLLWPATQLHYSCLALPAVATRPVLAAAFSLGIPLVASVATICFAAYAGARLLQTRFVRGSPIGHQP
jgi:hypothetical protein